MMTMIDIDAAPVPVHVRKQAFAAYGNSMAAEPPDRAMVSVFDGFIRVLRVAARARKEGRRDEEFHQLQKLVCAMQALRNGLDFEHGGDLAVRLSQYCTTIIHHTQMLSLDEDADRRYLSIYRQLLGMRDAFAVRAGVPKLANPPKPGGEEQKGAPSPVHS